jgi:anti-anti-sigma factor
VLLSRIFRFGPYEVDLGTGELRKNGRKRHLQEKPFQVLSVLLEQRCKLVTRDELRQRLWPRDTFVDFENGLNTAVSKLRHALCDSAEDERYIETLPRRGYRFVAHVEEPGVVASAERKELEIQKSSIEPDVVVVQIAGRFTFGHECQQVEWLIAALLSENEKKIVFDLSGVTRIDSTGVGIIVVCFGKVMKAGGELCIAGAKGVVEEALKLPKVDTILRLYPSVMAAVKGFGCTSGAVSDEGGQ